MTIIILEINERHRSLFVEVVAGKFCATLTESSPLDAVKFVITFLLRLLVFNMSPGHTSYDIYFRSSA